MIEKSIKNKVYDKKVLPLAKKLEKLPPKLAPKPKVK